MPKEHVTAVNPVGINQQQMTQRYAAMIQASDYGDSLNCFGGLDADIGSRGFCNPLSMSGSLFGGNGFGPIGVGSMGMGYGYGPGQEVMNMRYDDYLKYQDTIDDAQVRYGLHSKARREGAEVAASSSEGKVLNQVGILKDKIDDNEQAHIAEEYDKLCRIIEEKAKEEGYELSPEQVKAQAAKVYEEATGSNLISAVKDKGDSEVWHGAKEGAFGLGWLLTSQESTEDNVAHITGSQKSKSDKAWAWTGRITSAVVTLASIPFIYYSLKKG